MIMIRRDFLKCVVAACLAPFLNKVSANRIETKRNLSSICPLCGNDNIDIYDGVMVCNNQECGAEFSFHVTYQMLPFPSSYYTKKPKLSWNARKKLNKKRHALKKH